MRRMPLLCKRSNHLGTSLEGWTFGEPTLERARRGLLLLNPSIDLANPCNLNCPYCFIEEKGSSRKSRRSNELSLNETLGIIEDFSQAGAQTINIVGAGEPLLDPSLETIVSRISELNMTTVVFTNGARMARDQRIVDFLYDHMCSVVLKFNALSNEIQDAVCGLPGYSLQRNEALRRLISAGFNSRFPTRLGIDTLAFQGNLEDIPVIHQWCREANVFPITAEFIPAGRTEDLTVSGVASLQTIDKNLSDLAKRALIPLTATQRSWLLSVTSEIDMGFGIPVATDRAYFGGGKCTQLLGLYVDIEGRIWPCVARTRLNSLENRHSPLGHIREGDLPSRVWQHSSYMHELRSAFSGRCPYKPPIEPGPSKSPGSNSLRVLR